MRAKPRRSLKSTMRQSTGLRRFGSSRRSPIRQSFDWKHGEGNGKLSRQSSRTHSLRTALRVYRREISGVGHLTNLNVPNVSLLTRWYAPASWLRHGTIQQMARRSKVWRLACLEFQTETPLIPRRKHKPS